MSHIPYYGEDLATPRAERPMQPAPKAPQTLKERDPKAVEDELFAYYY